ncbi:MAG: YbaK/EbsC family protein [Dehalococcoidia bacterium]|nr:YbaK/EbsC family protein [Dehalococcoidia bacterium]MDH5780957.1 YbaK/EbsC family protein [Dehalococcoidia bacterium]
MNLTAFLRQNKVEFEFVEKKSTHHALEASRATDIPLGKIVKTLVFVNQDSKPLIAIVRADYNVNRHKLESCSHSKSVKVASDEVAEKVTGYPTGGIPPVGHKKRLPVYLDQRVLGNEYVWCGGGARTRLVKLKVQDITKLVAPQICDISTQPLGR